MEFHRFRIQLDPLQGQRQRLFPIFGLSIGYITGETEGKRGIKGPDMDGMDFNMKFGWGMAPVSTN
jgi:hypothetical protein